MQQTADHLIRSLFHADPATFAYTQLVYLLFMVVAGAALTTFAAVFSGVLSWYERRVAGRIQSRIGPNRVGPAGFLVWIADALKLITKEDVIPTDADPVLFRLGPYFVVVGLVLTFVALPFGDHLIVADMNIGLFYVLSITALVVVGIIMSAWSSNSKWSLVGGIRSAAQVISYEIPAGLAVMVPVLLAGSLSTQGIIRAQGGFSKLGPLAIGGWPWNWFLFDDPMAFVSFFVFFTAALAEGNRTPFDLPEAESELVAGYNTEYSGMRFSYFFLTEWANVWVMSALVTLLFLGGWQIPGVDPAAAAHFAWYVPVSLLVFVVKVLVLVTIVVQVRWTLPRIRVDQMMILCWKYLVPIEMGCVLLTALWMWGMSYVAPAAQLAVHMVFFVVAGAIPLVLFIRQTAKNLRLAGEHVDFSNW
ncbi:MAG TPA: NADH-quinone oxidoreductase subunit NuoH [Myxococcales bacterium]|nr:NADH-quinone oxidoreductase subunit NuoH [Myxococcales bacterium]